MAIVCFVIMFMHLGSLGTFAIFIRPIAEENNFSIGSVMIIISFANVAATVASTFVGQLLHKYTAKSCLLASSILCASHYFIFGFTRSLLVYWLSSIMGGIVIALGTSASIGAVIAEWFIEKRASVLGLVFGGASFGSAVWQVVCGALIVKIGYRHTYFFMGAVLAIVSILANLLFLRLPHQIGQKALGHEAVEKMKTSERHPHPDEVSANGITMSQARKSVAYWILSFGVLLSTMCIAGAKSYFPTFLTGEGVGSMQASTYSSLLALFGAVLMAFGGFLSEKMGNKVYMIYMHVAFSLGAATLVLNKSMAPAVILLSTVLMAAASPVTTAAMVPTITTEVFGNRDYPKIMASLITSAYLGHSLSPIIAAQILKYGGTLSFIYSCLGVGALIGVVLLITGFALSPVVRLREDKVKSRFAKGS